jgi:hypothetical protein
VDFQPMSPEERERLMQFLLQQQAQFFANQTRFDEHQSRFEENQARFEANQARFEDNQGSAARGQPR